MMSQTLREEIVAPETAWILFSEPWSSILGDAPVTTTRGRSARGPQWKNGQRNPCFASVPISSISLPSPGVSLCSRMASPVMDSTDSSVPISSSILSAKPLPEALMTHPIWTICSAWSPALSSTACLASARKAS